METGIVTETKYGKTRSAETKTSVFATSNRVKNMSAPLQSRFFIAKAEPYTTHKLEREIANLISNPVWDNLEVSKME